ncbi:MAG: hypothetical protein A2Y41_13330 [Spirochaetes bacterium GWB1_36_13]|nr:MAG: hypothetical protein A2Y41_13330 [Spirochaetes bacterium GWB1_36_13]
MEETKIKYQSGLKAFFHVFYEKFLKKHKNKIIGFTGLAVLIYAGVSVFSRMDYNWNMKIIPEMFVYYGEDTQDVQNRKIIAEVIDYNIENQDLKLMPKEVLPENQSEYFLNLRTLKNSDLNFKIQASQISGKWEIGKEIVLKNILPPKTFTIEPGGRISLKIIGWQMGPLLEGTLLTIFISAISILLGIILGTIVGLWRLSVNPLLKFMAKAYVEIVRGTPLLVQIYVFYFFIGKILSISNLTAGIAALSFFTGAYVAEIIRAGIQSIHKGQMEAARAVGMTYFQAMRHIIMPQAFKRILPPLAGQFISLIKDSSLVSIISLNDITFAAQQSITITFATFEIWFAAAGVYLVLTSSFSALTHYLEKRLLG